MNALVVGAGIHGVTVACELASHGFKVTIIESNREILLGTSNGTHNRVNMGYHYPRSIETVRECNEGFEYFKRNLSSALFYPSSCYYLIEKNNSKVTAKEYNDLLDEVDLKYSIEFPKQSLIDKKNIEMSFKVWEPCYDVSILRRMFHQKIENLRVTLWTGFEIVDADIDGKNVTIKSSTNHTFKDKFDVIVNATYAFTNNVQKIFGCNEVKKKYKFQKTEVVVATMNKKILPAMTVMDGPFITILPYAYGGHKNEYLVYDVVNSVREESVGHYLPRSFTNIDCETNYSEMLVSGRRYFTFMDDLVPRSSLWATRPIPLNTFDDDARITNLVKHDNHDCFYSMLEGKFVSAPLLSQKITNTILEDLSP